MGTCRTCDGDAGCGRVAVIGGGISGLATAWFLRRDHPDMTVVVHEAADRVGGKVFTTELAGEPFDVGADAFLARQPEFRNLCLALGLGDELVAPASGAVWLWLDGELRALPGSTVLGIPTDIDELEGAGILSEQGARRAQDEANLGPPRLGPDEDPTVADFVATRFGAEVLERLVDPLLSGIHAGTTNRLGLRSAAGAIADLADEAVELGCSMTEAAQRRRAAAGPDQGPVFLTVRGGLGVVVERMAEELDVRLGSEVDRLARADGEWLVGDESFDAVVLATPAWASSRLVARSSPGLSSQLDRIAHAGVAVVSLALGADIQLPDGSGMLVPRGGDRWVKAVTWSSRKWPHLAQRGVTLLRCSVGRIDDVRHVALSDEDLLAIVLGELDQMLGVDAVPLDWAVTRWPRALPQYDSGHLDRMRRIESAAADIGVVLAGAAHGGVGLPSRVRQARMAADLAGHLARRRT